MKRFTPILVCALFLLVIACNPNKSVCPDEEGPGVDTSSNPTIEVEQEHVGGPALVPINGKEVSVDKLVSGVLCNDEWAGTIYVGCDIEVADWEEDPFFLDGCSLDIKEGTVVYVADHNNTAFYKGCSCHYSEQPEVLSSE